MRNTKSAACETWSTERVKELTMRKINESRATNYNPLTPRKMSRGLATAVIAAVLVLTSVGGVLAAQYFLKPAEIAQGVGDTKLGAAFLSDSAININQSATSGGYVFTLLSVVSGSDLTDLPSYRDNELQSDRTYAVLAIQNAEGTVMDITASASFLATPLINGLEPWKYNAVTMNGDRISTVIDGVMYAIVSCEDITMFADRGLYFAVCESMFIDNATFNFDEATGKISVNPNYSGANAVFDLPIDKSLANPAKAAEWLANNANESVTHSYETDISIGGQPDVSLIFQLPDKGTPPESESPMSVDWLNAAPVESTLKVLTATADGELIFTFDFYGGGGTVSALYDDCFKDGAKAAIVHISTTTDAEDNESSYAIRFSLGENGVITGAVATVE